MLAVFVNAGVVILGSLLGLLLGNRLKEAYTRTIIACMGICTMVIGISSAIRTADILIVIVCLVVGTIIGELCHIDQGLDRFGGFLKSRFSKNGDNQFTDGFISASMLFCVGSMSVLGSFDAGLRNDYSVILTKSTMDAIMAVTLTTTMGIGVAFSAVTILLYQGGLTLLATVLEPVLSMQAVGEMSAVGGVMLIATGFNIMGLGKERIKVANMLPALVLPFIWFAIRELF